MADKQCARRSSAIRAAKSACRKALDAPHYQAAEGVDFIIRVHDWLYSGRPDQMDDEYSFRLIGVCLEAAEAKKKDPTYVYRP